MIDALAAMTLMLGMGMLGMGSLFSGGRQQAAVSGHGVVLAHAVDSGRRCGGWAVEGLKVPDGLLTRSTAASSRCGQDVGELGLDHCSRVFPRIASSEDSTMAPSSRIRSSARLRSVMSSATHLIPLILPSGSLNGSMFRS